MDFHDTFWVSLLVNAASACAKAEVRRGPGRGPATLSGVSTEALAAIVDAHRRRDRAGFEAGLDRLIVTPRPELSAAVLARLESALASAWTRGWQPADVTRAVRRAHGPIHVRLLEQAMSRQATSYPESTVDRRWLAQLKQLPIVASERFLDGWTKDQFEAVRVAAETLATVATLPAIPRLIPPPGDAAAPPSQRRPTTNDPSLRMLDRVRALLAKAESSPFGPEAEAFTAKAQELTARYRIDEALLAQPSRDEPTAIRVGVDSPYEAARALLLQSVAEANLAQAVWSSELGFSTVFGFRADLAAIELIYTSLLVQGTAVMVREGSGDRAREFRESFLHAYADRIGDRLRNTTADAAQGHDDLLPVLASRQAAAREKATEVLGLTTKGRARVRDGHGWRSGRAAADAVNLTTRPPIS